MKLMRCLTRDGEGQIIRQHAEYGWLLVSGLLLGLLLGLLPGTAAAQESLCAEVKIDIAQELTLERQAFEAHMRINNGLSHITLEEVRVTVRFADEDGNPVETTSNPDSSTASFFIRLDSTENLGDLQTDPNNLDFTGMVNPSTSADIYWLIIPAPGARRIGRRPAGEVVLRGCHPELYPRRRRTRHRGLTGLYLCQTDAAIAVGLLSAV